jgi:hypothetical protein
MNYRIDNRLVIILIVILAGLGLILVADIFSGSAVTAIGAPHTAETPTTGGSVAGTPAISVKESIALPAPDHGTAKMLDAVLENRRSARQYRNSALTAPATIIIVANYTPFAQSGDDMAIRSRALKRGTLPRIFF